MNVNNQIKKSYLLQLADLLKNKNTKYNNASTETPYPRSKTNSIHDLT